MQKPATKLYVSAWQVAALLLTLRSGQKKRAKTILPSR
ncbi:hypothetical protein BSU04_35655 [Caballeronia sordidicola]|uniref:Uncharacterized protein n=1 Tax=Caballeronia sordidicola TaxID=196367 RepID=A0A226WRT3_CABSO|nr:hypothetical protein BSU04_35655 [Caballeronia sordidicola]